MDAANGPFLADPSAMLKGFAGAAMAAIVVHGVYRHYRRRKRLKLLERLAKSIERMRKMIRLLHGRVERMQRESERRLEKMHGRINVVRMALRKLRPQQARQILRQGIVEGIVRGVLWERALGLNARPSDDSPDGKNISERLTQWGEESDEDTRDLHTIHADLARTFPGREGFKPGGRCLGRLERVLRAYAAVDNQVRYVQGMNSVAGMACIASTTDTQAFRITRALMSHPFYRHREVFGKGKGGGLGFPLACQLGWILDRLMERYHPDLAAHLNKTLEAFNCKPGIFSGHNVAYMALKWFLTFFASVLPPELSLHVYDLFVADGHVTALRIAMMTLAERKAKWLKLPVGDPQVLTPRLWHNLGDGELPEGEAPRNSSQVSNESTVRPFWNQDPQVLMNKAQMSPPTPAEFRELQEEYVRFCEEEAKESR